MNQEYFQFHKDRPARSTYSAKILKDSITSGVRLTTMECTIPRMVLSEYNTHKVMSKNSASSRAIPVKKRIKAVEDYPFVPERFGKNKKGMQSVEFIEDQDETRKDWLEACSECVRIARKMAEDKVHKQYANRLLEPFSWHTIITTATEWENFFALRISKDAQPEIRMTAEKMKEAMDTSTPSVLRPGSWHLPLIFKEDKDFEVEELVKLSVARCARVSYLTHDGKRDPDADFTLYERLSCGGHRSPLEHIAKAGNLCGKGLEHFQETYTVENGTEGSGPICRSWYGSMIGNFRAPWIQFRKTIPGEAVFVGDSNE